MNNVKAAMLFGAIGVCVAAGSLAPGGASKSAVDGGAVAAADTAGHGRFAAALPQPSDDRRRTFRDCIEDLRRYPDGGLPVPPPPPTYSDGGVIPRPSPFAVFPDGGTGNPVRDRIRAIQQKRAAANH